jgi:hypothetical protein
MASRLVLARHGVLDNGEVKVHVEVEVQRGRTQYVNANDNVVHVHTPQIILSRKRRNGMNPVQYHTTGLMGRTILFEKY